MTPRRFRGANLILVCQGFMFNQRLYFQIIVTEKDKIKERYLNWYLPAINSNVK